MFSPFGQLVKTASETLALRKDELAYLLRGAGEGDLIEVEISSRQNNSDAFAFDGELFVDGDGGGDGSGWLDDQFQAFPENAHGGENFFLGDKSDFVDVFAEN